MKSEELIGFLHNSRRDSRFLHRRYRLCDRYYFLNFLIVVDYRIPGTGSVTDSQ
jgi:hypothetical protein